MVLSPPNYGLQEPVMQMRKIFGVSLAVLAIIVTFGALRIWWASRPPRLPRGWPSQSTWMIAYRPPLSLRPQGAWAACWLDAQRNVDKCKFGDYKGRVFYEDDYTTCNGQPPLPTESLRLENQGSIWILRLQDGTALLQANACNARNSTPSGPPNH